MLLCKVIRDNQSWLITWTTVLTMLRADVSDQESLKEALESLGEVLGDIDGW